MKLKEKRYHRPNRQSGWLMLEVSLALLLVASYAAMKVSDDYDAAVELHLKARTKALDLVKTAALEYARRYHSEIVAMQAQGTIAAPGSPIIIERSQGISDTYTVADGNHPTIGDLAGLGLLPGGFASTAIGGGNYGVALQTYPPECVRDECSIEGIAYIDQPYRTRNTVNFALAGRAVQLIGANGMLARREAPGVMSSYAGKFTLPSPLTPAVPGIIAIRFGHLSSPSSAKFASLSPAGANVAGTMTADLFLTPFRTAGEKCDADGSIASGASTVLVCSAGVFNEIWATSAQGNICTESGKFATDVNSHEALLCKNGKMVRLTNLLAKTVTLGQIRATDGKVIPKPTCDAGGVPSFSFESDHAKSGGQRAEGAKWTASTSGLSWVLAAPPSEATLAGPAAEYVQAEVINVECIY